MKNVNFLYMWHVKKKSDIEKRYLSSLKGGKNKKGRTFGGDWKSSHKKCPLNKSILGCGVHQYQMEKYSQLRFAVHNVRACYLLKTKQYCHVLFWIRDIQNLYVAKCKSKDDEQQLFLLTLKNFITQKSLISLQSYIIGVHYLTKTQEHCYVLFWIKDIQKCYVAKSTLKDDDHLMNSIDCRNCLKQLKIRKRLD